jgi:hypothetical protein
MRQNSGIVIPLVTLLLVAGTVTVAGSAYGGGPKEKAEMAAAAKVTIDQAVKAATENTAGKVIEAELEKKHDKLVWEVEVVTSENKVMEIHIDAETGAVISTEEKKAEAKKEKKRERKREHKD